MRRLGSIFTGLSVFFAIVQGIASWDGAMDRLNRWIPPLSNGISTLANIANIPIPFWWIIVLLAIIIFAWNYYQRRLLRNKIPLEKDTFQEVMILSNKADEEEDMPILLCAKCKSPIVGATTLGGLSYLVCENQHCIGNEIPFEKTVAAQKQKLEQWNEQDKKRKEKAAKEVEELRARVEAGELNEQEFMNILRSAPPLEFSEAHPPYVPKPTDSILLTRDFPFIVDAFYQKYLRKLLVDNLDEIPNLNRKLK